jgi:hypothetical protein
VRVRELPDERLYEIVHDEDPVEDVHERREIGRQRDVSASLECDHESNQRDVEGDDAQTSAASADLREDPRRHQEVVFDVVHGQGHEVQTRPVNRGRRADRLQEHVRKRASDLAQVPCLLAMLQVFTDDHHEDASDGKGREHRGRRSAVEAPARQRRLPFEQRETDERRVLQRTQPLRQTGNRALQELRDPEALTAHVQEVENADRRKEVEREEGTLRDAARCDRREECEAAERDAEVEQPASETAPEIAEVVSITVQRERDEKMRDAQHHGLEQQDVRQKAEVVRDERQIRKRNKDQEERTDDRPEDARLFEVRHALRIRRIPNATSPIASGTLCIAWATPVRRSARRLQRTQGTAVVSAAGEGDKQV